MARIEIYSNDSNVTLDDKVIGTDALDNSTKNFTVGDMLALGGGTGTTYTAGTGITIVNGVISSTVVDTDTNNFVSNVVLNGTDLDFTGTGGAFQSSVPLGSIADRTVTLAGTGGIAITGTYPSFTIDGSAISGGGGGTITGTGTANIMTKWITNTQIGDSIVIEDGNGVGIGIGTQPPAARLHVHNDTANNSRLKLTTQNSGIGPQDGLDITLVEGTAAQMWLYEPNIPLRFATNNAERFLIDSDGLGWFQFGLRITNGIVDRNTTKGTVGQILSSTGSEIEWINAPSAGTDTTYDYAAVGAAGNISLALTGSDGSNDVVTMQAGSKITLTDNGNSAFTVDHSIISTSKTTNTTTLAPGDTFKAIDAVTYSDGHLTQYREQTYTLPAAASPESLILRFIGDTITLQGQDLLFESPGTSTTTDSLHINPVELVPGSSGFEVVNACIAKVSLGAYIDNGPQNQAGQITFEIEENLSGVATQLGNATFDIQNQVGIIPITFLSFFDFQAGATYIFRAYSTQHEMDIVPGSFIQIEILK